MRTPRFILASALALASALGGCGDRRDGFSPMATKDAALVLGVNLDKDQAFKVVDAFVDRISGVVDLWDDAKEAKKKIAAYRQDLFRDVPPEARAFLDESGLRGAKCRWAVVSMDEFPVGREGAAILKGASLAIRADVELEKFFVAAERKLSESTVNAAAFTEEAVENERVWHLVPKNARVADSMKRANADPYVAWLYRQLVLVAFSREKIVELIRLYREGYGQGDALRGFDARKGEVLRIWQPDSGKYLQKVLPRAYLQNLKQLMPNGEQALTNLKSNTFDVKASADGTTSMYFTFEAASEEDAERLRTLTKMNLMMGNAQMEKGSRMPKGLAQKMFGGVKVGGTGAKIEIQGADLALVAGSLFPAVSSAILNAKTSAAAARGRMLFVALMRANLARESAGRGSIWPRTVASEGTDEKDVAGRACASAADYFNVLFDMKNYGTDEWKPCVDVNLSALGTDVVADKSIRADGLDWCVAANVTDAMPDNVPVLISANFNPALLLRKWKLGMKYAGTLPLGPASGAAKSMFDDKAVVVVRKGGSVQVIKKRFLTRGLLYNLQEFDMSDMKPPLVYLTPTGVVEPAGDR